MIKTKPYVDNFLIQRVIRNDSFLSHQEKLLLFILSTYRNVYRLSCDPLLKELAADFGRSTRTVQRVLTKVERKRWIFSIRRGKNKPNNYYFAPDLFTAFDALRCPKFKGWKGQLIKVKKICENGGFVTSRSSRHDNIVSHPYMKRSTEKTPKIETTNTCPHCFRKTGEQQ